MRTKQVSLTLPIMLAICLCFTASAQQAGRIESMKLLTPDVGWAATGKKLFWTTDGGAQWRDITPKLDHKEQRVSSVFFLDASTGWALLSCSDGRDPIADDVCFEFASTTNAGENWSVVHPKTVDPVPQSVITEDGQGFSGKTFLDFADAQHGWAILKRNLHVEASSGEMLRTVDGGHMWTQLPHDSLPMADRFCFVSTKDGWIAGGPDQELYRTHDAGDRWQLVSLAAPAQISKDMSPVYDLPVFVGEKTGYLQATYESSMSSGVPVVVFKTEDGGGTWHPLITTGTQPDAHPWTAYPSAIANGELLTATVSGGRIELSHTEQGAEAKHQSARIPVHASTVDQLSFVSPLRGWILATYWILSTSDGGASWMNVTPDPTGTVPSLASSDLAPSGGTHNRPTASPEGSAAVLPGAGNISTHLGFDTFPTQPTATMLAWSTSSPHYDAYVYLYGSPNKSTVKSKYPTKSWVSTTEGYGWGIIPIWFGLQSSCIINQPQVTQYFGPTVAEASDQGAEQADQAVTAAQTLGLPAGIIYTDIENYTVNSTCSPLVQAYVDAWVTEIHVYSGYIAGIYANPGPIKSDIHNQSVAPADVIWVTKVNSPPQVTIWNQGINDSWWPNSQRTHQFLLNQAATFAGVGPINIDPDIDNAPVLNANAVAKTYTYGTPTNISCPGAINTYPTAINDMSDGTFISASGQIGTVVGTFQAALGSPYYGFQNTGGSCTTISIQGAAIVEATGINNLGQIVGYFEGSDGAYHGFLQKPGEAPSQVDYNYNGQTAAGTYLYGINDAGQIVGYAYAPTTFYYQSFMYYNSQFYPLGPSGNFVYALGRGINGDAVLTGIYYQEPFYEDFELAATPSTGTPPSWNGTAIVLTPGGSANTQALGINANNELTGYYTSSACNDTSLQCGFMWTGGFLLTILQYGSAANVATGINDFGQVVGAYTDSTTQYSNGLWWTHQ